MSARLGDLAASACWTRACYLLDYTYLTYPDRVTRSLRYRSGFARLCAPESRKLPVYLDSAAFREAPGTAPPWSSYARYSAAIDLIRPDGAMARDVLDNQDASREGYDRLCRDGYRDVVIPVWQAAPPGTRTVTPPTTDGWRRTMLRCAATSIVRPWWPSADLCRARALLTDGLQPLRVCCDLPPLGLDRRMRLGGDVLFSAYPDGHLDRKGRLHR
jgi:hypothetical protein